MSINWVFTEKNERVTAQTARWNDVADAEFEKFGTTRQALADVQYGFVGEIITPWDPGYDKARRLSNPKFDDYPSIILMCACENDAVLALNLAWGGPAVTPFTVRAGGHCTAGFSASAGILIDVTGINDVFIDPTTKTAVVGAGCNFEKLSPQLDLYGLHLPIGDCPSVCVAGYMMGGGYSFTSRTFGMQCDNVLEVRVLLASGEIVTANPTQNYDLYWAVCGGTGGNFGILLSIKFQLHALGQIMGFSVAWTLETAADRTLAAEALVSIQTSYLSTLPSNMTPQLILVNQPKDGVQADLVPTLLWRGTFIGTQEAGMAAIQPVCNLPGAQFQWAKMGIFSQINKELLSTPYAVPPFPPTVTSAPAEDKQARYVARDLNQAEWLSILDWFITTPGPYNAVCFEIAGGAINGLPLETNAFIHRTAQFSCFLDVFWLKPEDEAKNVAFLNTGTQLMETFWNNEIYQNYVNLDVPDYRANYWAQAFNALAAVKAKYDPQTFFRFPQAAVPYPSGPIAPTWPPAVVSALQNVIQITSTPFNAAHSPVVNIEQGKKT